jgi:hypothetical protein
MKNLNMKRKKYTILLFMKAKYLTTNVIIIFAILCIFVYIICADEKESFQNIGINRNRIGEENSSVLLMFYIKV